MLLLFDKSVKLPKVKMPKVPGKKKVVQKPGSKGGKGYYDDKHVWHYGEKPTPKVVKQEEQPAAELPIPEEEQTIVTLGTNIGEIQVGTVLKYTDSLGSEYWRITKMTNLEVSYRRSVSLDDKGLLAGVSLDFLKGQINAGHVTLAETTAKPPAPTPGESNIHVGSVYYGKPANSFYHITGKEGKNVSFDVVTDEKATKIVMSNPSYPVSALEDLFNQGEFVAVGDSVISANADMLQAGSFFTYSVPNGDKYYYRVTSVDGPDAYFTSTDSHGNLLTSAAPVKTSLYGLKKFFQNHHGTLLNPGVGVEALKPSEKMKTPPAIGDVYYDAAREEYYHITDVYVDNPDHAVRMYNSQEFEPNSDMALYQTSWWSADSWNAMTGALSGAAVLKKVDKAIIGPHDISILKEGDVFHDTESETYMFISSVDVKNGRIEYYYSDDPEVGAQNYSSYMTARQWRDAQKHLTFTKHIDMPESQKNPYNVGDIIHIKNKYEEDVKDVRIFHVDDVHVYGATEGDSGEESFQQYSRSDLDRKVAAGMYDYIAGSTDKDEALPVPPPLAPEEEKEYGLPEVGDSFDGKYDNDLTQDGYWVVASIGKGKIVLHDQASYVTKNKPDLVLTLDNWRAAAGSYVLHPPTAPAKGYHPPAPAVNGDDSDGSDENAKKRVCAGLFNRLATDPEFFAFAQKAIPEMNNDDRGDAGLPYTEPESETDVMRQQARVYLAVRRLVHLWAITSADTQPKAQCMQRAVIDEFGINGAWDSMSSAEGNRISLDSAEGLGAFKELVDNEYARNGTAYRKFVRAQYDETQAFFAAKKMKKVTVYRGVLNSKEYVKFPDGEDQMDAQVVLQPQSSFTTHPSKAVEFANSSHTGVVYKASVPVSRCLSTALSGVGCLGEHEITLLGGPPETMRAYAVESYHDDTGSIGTAQGKIWKSRTYPLDALRREADWLRKKPYPIDEDIRDADWPKRTPNVALKELPRTLHSLGMSRLHLANIPSGKAFIKHGMLKVIRKK